MWLLPDLHSKKSSRSSSDNPYVGTQYEDLWNSNPYANNTRKDSIWDQIGNLFGFRTGADKWQDELDVRSAEFDSQIASVAREEEYNSESAKVQRMREAGLNPDLQGIQSASSASEFTEPETSPESNSELDSPAQIASVASSIFNGFQTAVGLFQSLQSMRTTKLNNTALDISNHTSMEEFASNVLLDAIDPRGFGHEYREKDPETGELSDWKFISGANGADLISKYGALNVRDFDPIDYKKINNVSFSRKKDARLFKESFHRVLNGLPQDVKQFKEWYNRESLRKRYHMLKGSSFYSPEDDEMALLIQPFATALDTLSKLEADLGIEKTSNDIEYEQGFDPSSLASAENAENIATSQQKDTDAKLNAVWNDLSSYFTNLKPKHPVLASVGLLVCAFLRSQNLQMHMTHRTTTNTAPNGEVTSYNRDNLVF